MKKTVLFRIFTAVVAVIIISMCFSACGKDDAGVSEPDSQSSDVIADVNNGEDAVTEPVFSGLNPLTGESGYDPQYENARPVAIMVENTPAARPQWGLCSPDIIFETEVEGGITRMMWVYANADRIPDKVGPVRSARNAYIELAVGLDAVYFHIGASDIAYSQLINRQAVDDIDGMYVDFFSRDYSRNVATEHTAYTTQTAMKNAIASKGFGRDINAGYKDPFSFVQTGAVSGGTDCTSIRTVFSSSYIHTFEYNAEDGLYYNYMNSYEMTDEYYDQMCVKNVVALYADMVDLGDAKGHVDVALTSGTGYFASEGRVIPVTWSKGGCSDMLEITDTNGNPVSFNAGKSWIGFVRAEDGAITVNP